MVKEFADVMAGIEKPAVMLDFLRAILTPQELDRIALRWRLVKMLKHGVKQRAIASKLGVSLCKITRGSRELKSGPKGFRDVVEKEMAKERKKK
ncbi:MAG: transcriptional regulator [Kiritimatiellae bacterium]|nr:transcriptional regulator [Kiritimatiellia bacterium]